MDDYLMLDAFTGKQFKSSLEKLYKIENDVNQRYLEDLRNRYPRIRDLDCVECDELTMTYVNLMRKSLDLDPIPEGIHVCKKAPMRINFELRMHLTEDSQPCIRIDFERD